jgi:hypothetical protein
VAGLCLVEVECLSLLLRQFDYDGALCCGGCRCLGLELGKMLPKPLPFMLQLLFGFGSQFKCRSQVIVGTSGSGFRLLTLPGVFGNQMLGSGNLLLCGGQGVAQAFEFHTQFVFRLAGQVAGRRPRP